MGTTLSTFILLVGVVSTGILSSLSASESRKKNYSKAEMWSGISGGVAALLVILTLFIVVKSHTGTGEITGAVESLAFGVMASFVLLLLSCIGIASLNGLSLYEAKKKDEKKTTTYSIAAAITSFGSLVLALVVIIFLL